MNAFKRRFQLENQLVFYMSYHRIWPILITAQVILASISPGWINSMNYSDSSQLEQCLRLNYAALMAAIYIPWYIMLDPIAGSLGAVLVLASTLFSNYVSSISPIYIGLEAWKIALPLHLIGWVAQFIGHAIYEKKKPALLHSLDQALITAPLFVLLEILFYAGYKPKLHHRVLRQVLENQEPQTHAKCI